MYKIFLSTLTLLLFSCGVYTFSGSTLPGHLKTVEVPLFVNESLQPDIADDITQAVTSQVVGSNLLRIVQGRGDAVINGTVRSYENREYFYDINRPRDATINKYQVRVTVSVEFADAKKNEVLYKGLLTGEGQYDFVTEKESIGRQRAVKDLADQIIQNSIQSW